MRFDRRWHLQTFPSGAEVNDTGFLDSTSSKAYFMRKRICAWKSTSPSFFPHIYHLLNALSVWELRGSLRICVSAGICLLLASSCRGQLLSWIFIFSSFPLFLIFLFPGLAMQLCSSELWPTQNFWRKQHWQCSFTSGRAHEVMAELSALLLPSCRLSDGLTINYAFLCIKWIAHNYHM